jgi:hypothetical protein
MKSIHLILLSFLFIHTSYCQNVVDMGTYNVPKNFGQPHDTYVSDDAVLFNYSPYVPVTNLSLVKFGLYQHALLKSGSEFVEKRIDPEQGVIQNCYYSGDTITEYIIYYKKGFPKYKYKFAVRWRSAKTMETFGEQKILAEYEFSNIAAYGGMRLVKAGSGYAFIEMVEDKGTVTFLSDDFQEINKVSLNSSTFNAIDCKQCYFALPNKDGSILVGFLDRNPGKINNKVLRLTADGETTWYETTLNNTEAAIASHGNYQYNPVTKELNWVFFVQSGEKYGYGIVKWDSKGVSEQHVKLLDFEGIFKNEPEITDYYKTKKLSTTDIWRPAIANMRLLNNGKEDYIIIQRPHITYELYSATYIIKVSEDGQFEWIKPILSEVRDPKNFFSATPYIANGKLRLLVADYSSNSKKEEHVNLSFRKEGGTISFFNLELDPKNGSELTNEKYDFTTEAGVQISEMLVDEKDKSVVIELHKGKLLSYKKLKL